ncbi:MAG: hypothetical protein ABEI86_14405, partial [Halobacteriaceae archaeon]
GFPSADPPADIRLEDNLIEAVPVVDDRWDDYLADEPPIFRQDPDETPEEFFLDYLSELNEFLKPQYAEQTDMDTAADTLGVPLVAAPQEATVELDEGLAVGVKTPEQISDMLESIGEEG